MATYRSSLPGSKLGKAFFYIIVKLHPFLNLRLFLYLTSSLGGLYIFNLYLVAFIFIISRVSSLFSYQRRLLLSGGNLCRQFFHRSVPKERQSWSGYRPFDTLIVFLKDALKKLFLKKRQQMNTKVIKSSSVQRVITFRFTFLRMYLLNKRIPDSNKYIHVYTNLE